MGISILVVGSCAAIDCSVALLDGHNDARSTFENMILVRYIYCEYSNGIYDLIIIMCISVSIVYLMNVLSCEYYTFYFLSSFTLHII